MFSQLFGAYLVKSNIITKVQFNEVIEHQKITRVKLGLIAISKKLLTVSQAEEINLLQVQEDKRFGDIAIAKGYLTTEQVSDLLSLQGNEHLIFVQTMIDKEYLTFEEIEVHLSSYQKDNDFSDADLDALKTGDINSIVPVFVQICEPYYNELISLTLRNIIRFIDTQIRIEKFYPVSDYSFEHLASQSLHGKHNIFLGFSSKGTGLLSIADAFAKEVFKEVNDESLDAVCEFINCINGLFASKLSNDDIDIDMFPPLCYSNQTIKTDNTIYIVPLHINDIELDLILSIDGSIEII